MTTQMTMIPVHMGTTSRWLRTLRLQALSLLEQAPQLTATPGEVSRISTRDSRKLWRTGQSVRAGSIRVGPRAAVRAKQPPREERGAETDHDRDHQELEHAATLTRE